MTYGGTRLTGPAFIYFDELLFDNNSVVGDANRPGALICNSTIGQVSWRNTAVSQLYDISSTVEGRLFSQIKSGARVVPSVSRLTLHTQGRTRDDSAANGLFTCFVSSDDPIIPVGLYARSE